MHRMISLNKALMILPVLALFVTGCKKEYDHPPERTLPLGSVMTIQQLKDSFALANAPLRFTHNENVFATVISDEQDGNFYKNVYVQDSTGGICLRLLSSGGLYVGDRIRIYLPGTVVAPYAGLMQIDSVNVDNNVVKQATQQYIQPQVVTMDQITPEMQSTLVILDSVEFIASEAAGGTWATFAGSSSTNRTLEDCDGNQIILRTSDFANYAGDQLPTGRGSIVCVVGLYNTDMQLYARSMPEVHLNGPRCPGQELPFFNKNFNDGNVASGGWTQYSTAPEVVWTTNDIGSNDGTPYGQVKNYIGGSNIACTTWLLSPSIDLTGANAPLLSFITGCNYTGANLEVYVSTDYTNGDPSAATWMQLPAAISPGAWTWTSSGALDLAPFQTSNVHIGFKYTGTSSDGKTWELDDIKIIEQ